MTNMKEIHTSKQLNNMSILYPDGSNSPIGPSEEITQKLKNTIDEAIANGAVSEMPVGAVFGRSEGEVEEKVLHFRNLLAEDKNVALSEVDPEGVLRIMPTNNIIFGATDSEGNSLLAISSDGFYVRGEKLKQDENEARLLFEAMKDCLHRFGVLPHNTSDIEL